MVKKIGKAQPDPENGIWTVEAKSGRFLMNQRLVDLRPEVKKAKSVYSKHASQRHPPVKRSEEFEAYHAQRKALKAKLASLLVQIYKEILEESFTSVILLRQDRVIDYKSDWRFGLYRGIIYQFDRPGYTGDEMIKQIEAAFPSA